ncbi:hypothetical protein HERIO_1669 [Hepatospora eriocheir]|uniref:Uncharacterized protein n=1 Tax=Hepatospora eriocheir TaxID=1081669 RepID=A0A1X0Q9F7_9MICR|nr:hypothetical protein HERIO_1669 [Hepatospora eriocheir]
MIGLSPSEFTNNISVFDPLQRVIKIDRSEVITRSDYFKQKSAENMTDKYRKYEHQIGETVYLKNEKLDKYANKWNGPFKITSLNDNQTVWIENELKKSLVNIRRVRPKEERAECGDCLNDQPTNDKI